MAVTALTRTTRAHYYAQIPEPLLESRNPSDVAVYGFLDRRSGARGYWHTTRRQIAEAVGYDERTVRRALARLEAAELITISEAGPTQGGTLTCFTLTERAAPAPHFHAAPPDTRAALPGHGRRTSATRTLLGSEKPSEKPYRHIRSQTAGNALGARSEYNRATLRDWPAVQRRLGL